MELVSNTTHRNFTTQDIWGAPGTHDTICEDFEVTGPPAGMKPTIFNCDRITFRRGYWHGIRAAPAPNDHVEGIHINGCRDITFEDIEFYDNDVFHVFITLYGGFPANARIKFRRCRFGPLGPYGGYWGVLVRDDPNNPGTMLSVPGMEFIDCQRRPGSPLLVPSGTPIECAIIPDGTAWPAFGTSGELEPPVNTVLPAITGTVQQGQTLSCSTGTWTNTPLSYTRQWQRGNSAGTSWSDISGATSSTYVLTSSDVGYRIRCRVQATNADGTTGATSNFTTVVTIAAPANTSAPSISGTEDEGSTLTCDPGLWTNAGSTFAYQWRRCNSGGTSCVNIPAATSPTYLLTSDDVGGTVRCVVSTSNLTGTTSATSAASGVIDSAAVAPPANTVLPAVTGTAAQGSTLTTDDGTWSGSPSAYSYQWQRSATAAGSSFSNITGATSDTYVLTSSDVGRRIRCRVTALNAGGSTTASSGYTDVILSTAPVNTVAPAITGTATVGQALTCDTGTWTNSPTAYAYQWRRCDEDGLFCVDIEEANSSTYLLVDADETNTVRCTVSAVNNSGTVDATSDETSVIAAAAGDPPLNTITPVISGTETPGSTLTVTDGSWTEDPTSFTYQWLRCDEYGGVCVDISGETDDDYLVRALDLGSTIRCRVTAYNADGQSASTSAATGAIEEGDPEVVDDTIEITDITPSGVSRYRLLGWDAVEGAYGFIFNVDGRLSRTNSGTRTTLKVSRNADEVTVQALVLGIEGEWIAD